MIALVLLALLLLTGFAAVCGWLPDTRDADSGGGRIAQSPQNRASQASGR